MKNYSNSQLIIFCLLWRQLSFVLIVSFSIDLSLEIAYAILIDLTL